MSKFIEDQARLDYIARLKELQQIINPKPTEEEIEKRKQQHLAERG